METQNNLTVTKAMRGSQSNFYIFTLARLISELGSSIFKFALSLYILDITGSAAAFSMILALSIFPGVFVNIFGGVLVDKSNKKKIIVWSELISAIVLFLLFFLFQNYSTSLILFTSFSIVLSIINAFFSLALNASIPNLAEKEHVTKLNSSYQGLGSIINILGPILGALLYRKFGFSDILLFEGTSFILAGIIELFLIFRVDEEQQEYKSYMEGFKDVWRYLKSQETVIYLLFIVVIINFMLVPLMSVVLPFIIYKGIELTATQLSWIQAMWSVGFIGGAIVVSIRAVGNKVINKLFVLVQLQSILIVMWVFPKLSNINLNNHLLIVYIYCIILAIGGFFNAMTNIPMLTYLQLHIPEKLRASVFGVVNTAIQIAVPLGIWGYGLALEKVNWTIVVSISGTLLLIVALLAHQNKPLRSFFQEKNDG